MTPSSILKGVRKSTMVKEEKLEIPDVPQPEPEPVKPKTLPTASQALHALVFAKLTTL
jgi:hypothetical protein